MQMTYGFIYQKIVFIVRNCSKYGLLEICYSLPVYLINTYHVLNSTSDFL